MAIYYENQNHFYHQFIICPRCSGTTRQMCPYCSNSKEKCLSTDGKSFCDKDRTILCNVCFGQGQILQKKYSHKPIHESVQLSAMKASKRNFRQNRRKNCSIVKWSMDNQRLEMLCESNI